ncbi:hypothetical protein FisN_31Hh018 [Fistulifera solaris]|uniref:Uncharacterized protein n=1 Tax=Fistulifera solaris TaxID=1519565 RepID=A0A1Z5JWC6_FISSO|nr:hypothetical protein FisN_31Hh018 [Fistulifera solaris]|eukprot:GAX18229.1 hypothetical protein FisN_31Hh018 [Fistulifera solaris]
MFCVLKLGPEAGKQNPTPNRTVYNIGVSQKRTTNNMMSSFASVSLKAAALLVFVFGIASQKHAVAFSGDRSIFKIALLSCFNRITTRMIDSGAEESFDLNEHEWIIFEVFQEVDIGCACTVTCLDESSRIDVYLTYERRPRLYDNWDGWDCKETLPSNTQTCEVLAPEPDSTCRVAVRGDLLDRPHSKCTITCNVDDAPSRMPLED